MTSRSMAAIAAAVLVTSPTASAAKGLHLFGRPRAAQAPKDISGSHGAVLIELDDTFRFEKAPRHRL